MGGQNKKESVAALHRENILLAAEKLFFEKGVTATTIDDISKMSDYSKRTIYIYYKSKNDILHHIVLKGLRKLKENLDVVLKQQSGFIEQYRAICDAMEEYQANSPQSFDSVKQMKSSNEDVEDIPQVITQIFESGTEINTLLANFIEQGKQRGIVRRKVEPMKTVYVIWSSISSLLSLVQTKGIFLENKFSTSREVFLEYGYKQIINSILEENMRWE